MFYWVEVPSEVEVGTLGPPLHSLPSCVHIQQGSGHEQGQFLELGQEEGP